MRILSQLSIILVTWFAVMGMSFAQESNQRVEEYTAKALYIFNFARFTDWPPATLSSNDASVLLCVYGEDPFDSALIPIKNKPIKDRILEIKYIKRGAVLDGCHILFVSESEHLYLKQIVNIANSQHLLTVSDISGFAKAGGIIGLVSYGKKIRFEINVLAARNAGLTISSKLLNLATIVDKLP